VGRISADALNRTLTMRRVEMVVMMCAFQEQMQVCGYGLERKAGFNTPHSCQIPARAMTSGSAVIDPGERCPYADPRQ
jgi:hypothetical protein